MGKGGGHNKGQTMPYSSLRAFGGRKPMRQGHWNLSAAQHSLLESLLAANARDLELEASIIDRSTGETVWQPTKCGVCRTAWATEAPRGEDVDAWSLCRECFETAADDLPEQPNDLEDFRRHPATRNAPAEAPTLGEVRGEKTSPADAELEHSLGTAAAAAFEAVAAPYMRTNRSPGADPSALLAALDRLGLPRAVWADGTVAAVAHGMLWTMQAEPHATTGAPCGVWSVASPVAARGRFLPEGAARFIHNRRIP